MDDISNFLVRRDCWLKPRAGPCLVDCCSSLLLIVLWLVYRLDEAEAYFNAALKAVQDLDMKQVGEKLLCSAHMHRAHTRDVAKHKVRGF